ncbi:unnamed protein product (macronuclear) [Paramecium tetraurelia]|uniref:Proline dehydrogenase n=1 Tax=Paramecium tetraurelia TaxID=5888 RepID=A0BNS3_PARTE|nr:uncharacterized protein GSPATT00030829001 [Paramecium tetraurelia]CAK60190.1 unnamed protein product [Paramecium tetraurelia]|eukprot:XP_001427588.1 hypothetical protein (macronuclear) [Paramecium tetraurelia strain d4-2]
MIPSCQKFVSSSRVIYNFAVANQTRYVSARYYNQSSSQLQYYQSLRIHKDKSVPSILNNLLINHMLKYDWVVDQGPKLFDLLYAICGTRLANFLVNHTIGKVFTAGENLESVERYLSSSNNKISYIIDYCSEAVEGIDDCEKFYDENSSIFRQTVLECAKKPEKKNMIAIKVSSLIDMNLLKQINKARLNIFEMFSKIGQGKSIITLEQVFSHLKEQGINMNENEQKQFIKGVLKFNKGETEIDEITWRYRVQPIFMFETELNNNPAIKYMNNLNEKHLFLFEQFIERVKYFMDPALQNKVCVMVDAEQTYLQWAIDSFSEQMEAYYNQNQTLVYNTFQNYLKQTKDRVDFELAKANKFKLNIGIKMVRGAYMVEESKLASDQAKENPINDGYEATTAMIERNLEQLILNIRKSPTKVFVASHNEKTVEFVKELMHRHSIPNQGGIYVLFAQLYGLSDHVTYQLASEGYRIYKYVPFGKTEIMIPYLMRRAQETKKVLQSSTLQTLLLIDELKYRFYLK